jgi:hypothetical protein
LIKLDNFIALLGITLRLKSLWRNFLLYLKDIKNPWICLVIEKKGYYTSSHS